MPICFKFSGHGIIIYCADSYAFTALLSDVVTIVSSSCLLASVTFAFSAFLPFAFSCSSGSLPSGTRHAYRRYVRHLQCRYFPFQQYLSQHVVA